MDFGIRAPTVVLWAALDSNNVIWIVDERVVTDVVLDDHIEAIKNGLARDGIPPWPRPDFLAPDPAGWGTNDHTGTSSNSTLIKHGFQVRTARGSIQLGATHIRARLAPASGEPPRLYVHARCTKLIESLERYHYPKNDTESLVPVKGEGFDHAIDALRYLVLSIDQPSKAERGSYV